MNVSKTFIEQLLEEDDILEVYNEDDELELDVPCSSCDEEINHEEVQSLLDDTRKEILEAPELTSDEKEDMLKRLDFYSDDEVRTELDKSKTTPVKTGFKEPSDKSKSVFDLGHNF